MRPEVWEPLKQLVGKWEGTGNGHPVTSKVQREYRLVLNDKFLHVQNRSVYDPQPKNPSAFRFAKPGKLAGIFRHADAIDISERIFKFHIEAPISVEEFWTMRSETSEILREKLKSLTEEQSLQVAEEAREKVREFFPNNQMSFPAQIMIVTGKKDGPNKCAGSLLTCQDRN
jgi:hypothetical protein